MNSLSQASFKFFQTTLTIFNDDSKECLQYWRIEIFLSKVEVCNWTIRHSKDRYVKHEWDRISYKNEQNSNDYIIRENEEKLHRRFKQQRLLYNNENDQCCKCYYIFFHYTENNEHFIEMKSTKQFFRRMSVWNHWIWLQQWRFDHELITAFYQFHQKRSFKTLHSFHCKRLWFSHDVFFFTSCYRQWRHFFQVFCTFYSYHSVSECWNVSVLQNNTWSSDKKSNS